MRTRTTIPISEARKKIFNIANEVQKPDTFYTLTEKGKPKAILISAEEFESWIETLKIVRQFPNIDKDIKEAKDDYKKGSFITLEEVMKKEGYVPINKKKNV